MTERRQRELLTVIQRVGKGLQTSAEDREDICAEALRRLLPHEEKVFINGSPNVAYIKQALCNLVTDRSTRRSTRLLGTSLEGLVGDGFEPHDPSAEIPFNEVEEGEVIPANLRDEHRQALAALLEADCNQSEAARLLGLSETTFRRRLAALRRIIQAHLVRQGHL